MKQLAVVMMMMSCDVLISLKMIFRVVMLLWRVMLY